MVEGFLSLAFKRENLYSVELLFLKGEEIMAVVIRLSRIGTKHAPKYRVTVADSRRYATSKYLEILGYYIPTTSGEKKVVLDLAKTHEWIKKGAQPSDRVKHVIKLAEAAK